MENVCKILSFGLGSKYKVDSPSLRSFLPRNVINSFNSVDTIT